jgi:hypothetical protein
MDVVGNREGWGRKKGNWKMTFVAKGPKRLGEGRLNCEGGRCDLEWGWGS